MLRYLIVWAVLSVASGFFLGAFIKAGQTGVRWTDDGPSSESPSPSQPECCSTGGPDQGRVAHVAPALPAQREAVPAARHARA